MFPLAVPPPGAITCSPAWSARARPTGVAGRPIEQTLRKPNDSETNRRAPCPIVQSRYPLRDSRQGTTVKCGRVGTGPWISPSPFGRPGRRAGDRFGDGVGYLPFVRTAEPRLPGSLLVLRHRAPAKGQDLSTDRAGARFRPDRSACALPVLVDDRTRAGCSADDLGNDRARSGSSNGGPGVLQRWPATPASDSGDYRARTGGSTADPSDLRARPGSPASDLTSRWPRSASLASCPGDLWTWPGSCSSHAGADRKRHGGSAGETGEDRTSRNLSGAAGRRHPLGPFAQSILDSPLRDRRRARHRVDPGRARHHQC